MSRVFVARSRKRSGAREIVLNTGCENDKKVIALGEQLLLHTTGGRCRVAEGVVRSARVLHHPH